MFTRRSRIARSAEAQEDGLGSKIRRYRMVKAKLARMGIDGRRDGSLIDAAFVTDEKPLFPEQVEPCPRRRRWPSCARMGAGINDPIIWDGSDRRRSGNARCEAGPKPPKDGVRRP